MRDENIEHLWHAFLLTRGMILLILLSAVVLFSKWLLRRILWNRTKRRRAEHPIAHSLGTLPPPRNFDASQFKAIDRSPTERKKRVG